MQIASKIRVARLLAGFDQRELATSLGMKSATHVNRWEQGMSTPRPAMLRDLGKALDLYWPWFLDSTLPYSQQDYVSYRPLSPYVDYTDKWLTLMPKHLAELLPDFLSELQFVNISTFSAPCGGGIIVATNNKLPIMITCRPELFPTLLETIPNPNTHTITDIEFAEQLFKGTLTQKLFSRTGVNTLQIEPTIEPPPIVTIAINLSASIKNTVDIAGIQDRLDKKMQKLIKDSELEEVKLDVLLPQKVQTNLWLNSLLVIT